MKKHDIEMLTKTFIAPTVKKIETPNKIIFQIDMQKISNNEMFQIETLMFLIQYECNNYYKNTMTLSKYIFTESIHFNFENFSVLFRKHYKSKRSI